MRVKTVAISLFFLFISSYGHAEILDISASYSQWVKPFNHYFEARAAAIDVKDETSMHRAVNAAIVSNEGFHLQYPLHFILDVEDGTTNRFYLEASIPVPSGLSIPEEPFRQPPVHRFLALQQIRSGTCEYINFDYPSFDNPRWQVNYINILPQKLVFPSPLNEWYSLHFLSQQVFANLDRIENRLKDNETYIVARPIPPLKDSVLIDKKRAWWETQGIRVEYHPIHKIPTYIHLQHPDQLEVEFRIESIDPSPQKETFLRIPDEPGIPVYSATNYGKVYDPQLFPKSGR
ncbi:MAG: hypothetical protein RBU29_13980 [bacterium]|jgi:hypothetical protein|nr:hypothetical protein [bacterium]